MQLQVKLVGVLVALISKENATDYAFFQAEHPFMGKGGGAVAVNMFSGWVSRGPAGFQQAVVLWWTSEEELGKKKKQKQPSAVLLTTMCAGDGDLASLSACLLWRLPGWTSSRGHFICRYWMAERKQNGKKETKHVNNAESKKSKKQIKNKTTFLDGWALGRGNAKTWNGKQGLRMGWGWPQACISSADVHTELV